MKNLHKRTISIFLALSVIIGAFLTFSPGTFFVIILAAICAFFLLKYLPADERKFVLWVFVIGLILRVVVAVTLDAAAFACFKEAAMQKIEEKSPPDFNYRRLIKEKTRCFFKMSDSDYYSMRGYVYTAYAKGIDNILIRRYLDLDRSGYGWSGYLYIIGLFYYLFDYSPVAVKFLNCLFGTLGAIFIYKIGLTFSKKVARTALLMVMFFPSLVIWSAANFKGPFLVLLSAVTIWSFIVFLKNKRNWFLVISVLGIIIQLWFSRAGLWVVLLASILLSFIMMLFLRKRLILIPLFVIICIFLPKNINMLQHLFMKSIVKKAYIQHIGHVKTSGITYKVLDDKYYQKPDLLDEMKISELVPSVIKSIWHFLFEPFPKRMANLPFLVAYIQMLLWYLLVFFAFLGVARGTIYGSSSYLPLLFYVVIGTIAIAVGSGNIGTLLRHRDILSPFYFVFAAVGITYIFGLEGENNESLSEV